MNELNEVLKESFFFCYFHFDIRIMQLTKFLANIIMQYREGAWHILLFKRALVLWQHTGHVIQNNYF